MEATIEVTTPMRRVSSSWCAWSSLNHPFRFPDLTTMIDVKCSAENQFQLVCMVMLNQPPSAPRASRWRRIPPPL